MSDLFSGLTTSLKSTATALQRNEYVRKIAETINDTVMNYSEPELAVREATNEDPWGPTGPQMKKIVEYTRSRHMEDFYNVYTPLFTRMLENNKDAWRRVYKSLVLFDYLLKNGSERFVNESREKIYEIRRLESYKYVDDKGKDQGINIRHRAKLILELLNDDEQLQAERRKANSDDKSKYRGYDQYEMKMSSSGFGSSSSSNWNNKSSSDFNRSSSDFPKTENREVSNFAFSGNNRSPSPELGFANDDNAKKNSNDDDDGFGDFVSSRSNCAAKSTAAMDLFGGDIPAIAPPAATGISALPRKPSISNETSNVDLLGGFDSAPSAAPTPAVDLFSLAPAPTTTAVPQAAQPKASNVDLFGFDSMPATTSTPATTFGATNDISGLGDFGFNTMLTPNSSTTSQVTSNQESQNKGNIPAPKVGNSFAGLDDFMNLSLNSGANNAPKPKTLNQMKGSY